MTSLSQNVILEESFEASSEELEDSEEQSPIKKEKEKLMIASLDFIDKKKRESFANNLRLSIKAPNLNLSDKENLSETRAKIDAMKISRREIEFHIEEKVFYLYFCKNTIMLISCYSLINMKMKYSGLLTKLKNPKWKV